MKKRISLYSNQYSVSSVIGIILTIAIVVAISASVYISVQAMVSSSPKNSGRVQFMVDESNDRLIVIKVEGTITWNNLGIKSSEDITVLINGEVLPSTTNKFVEDKMYPLNQSTFFKSKDPTDFILSNDHIDIEGSNGKKEDITMTITNLESNILIGKYSFQSLLSQQ